MGATQTFGVNGPLDTCCKQKHKRDAFNPVRNFDFDTILFREWKSAGECLYVCTILNKRRFHFHEY